MNKKLLLCIALLIIVGGTGLFSHILTEPEHFPEKVWLHRCNSLEKLHEKGDKYHGFEVDICLRPDGRLDVTHNIEQSFGLSVDTFFAYLEQRPEKRMWMDVKNLSEENQRAFVTTMDSLSQHHQIAPERIVVESREWQLLRPLTQRGYLTSYYVNLEKNDSAIALLQRVADSGAVRALSFPRRWYRTIKSDLNRQDIVLLTWCSSQSFRQLRWRPLGHRMLRDRKLKVILTKDHGHYHR